MYGAVSHRAEKIFCRQGVKPCPTREIWLNVGRGFIPRRKICRQKNFWLCEVRPSEG